MKNIKYLGGEWKYLKKKRESLQNLLVPSSLLNPILNSLSPTKLFRDVPRGVDLTIPSLQFLPYSPLPYSRNKKKQRERKYLDDERLVSRRLIYPCSAQSPFPATFE